jgi:hypothetical protein
MTRRFTAPRAGTRAYLALEKLHALSGQTTCAEWMRAIAWKESMRAFDEEIASVLVQHRLVFQRGNLYVITDDGSDLLGIAVDAPGGLPPMPAGPRITAPPRQLSSRHIPSMRLAREGSLDYLEIPSRIGDTLIPHRTKA